MDGFFQVQLKTLVPFPSEDQKVKDIHHIVKVHSTF